MAGVIVYRGRKRPRSEKEEEDLSFCASGSYGVYGIHHPYYSFPEIGREIGHEIGHESGDDQFDQFATPPYSPVPTVIMISIAADASLGTWLGSCCSPGAFLHEVPISLDVLSSDRAPQTLNQAAETVGQSDDVSAKTRASRWANDRRSLPNSPQFDRPAFVTVVPIAQKTGLL
ncbi:uncharacterized protein BDW70DRAFT_60054 [Aspergillus foveolatus]|uniref:uncharacterized protein n=1 Tax=Aspergillus foveolatus TaxID=210207 RepID=UPI003CCD1F89